MKEMFTASNGDRNGARNVAVVITDGEANVDRWMTVPYAVEARIAGIYIVTLAVGTLADTNMLQNIASRPHDKTILQASYGHELPAFRDRIFMTSCDGIKFALCSCFITCFAQSVQLYNIKRL